MREWPSLVPGAPADYFIVVNHYGRFGAVFAETDINRADYETTVADMMSGQHSDPLRVITFNPATDRAADVSQAIAREILRRLARHVNMANSPNASVTRMSCTVATTAPTPNENWKRKAM